MLMFKKKKVLRLSSASFLRALCDILQRGTVNCSCLRFLAGKKRQNSQNFSAKMLEKISHFSHFFALLGNTAYNYQTVNSRKLKFELNIKINQIIQCANLGILGHVIVKRYIKQHKNCVFWLENLLSCL